MKSIVDEKDYHKKHYHLILDKLRNDPYAQHLGISVKEFSEGFAKTQLTVKDFMLNAHSTVHGAVIYALADFAFAVACNSWGKMSVGLTTTAHFMKSALEGDTLIATATEQRRNHRTGFYQIAIESSGELIASVDAVAYRKDHYLFPVEQD